MSVTIYAEKPVSNRKSMYIDTKIIKIFFCEKRCIILIKSFRCQMGLKLKKTSEAFILNKIKITYCKGFKIIIMNELEKSMNERS